MSDLPSSTGTPGYARGQRSQPIGWPASPPLLLAGLVLAALLSLLAALALRQIASLEDFRSRTTHLATVDVASQQISPLVDDKGLWYWGPAWSPNGQSLVYTLSTPNGKAGQLYLSDGDGRNARPLTHNDRANYLPAWSPDGKRIAYLSQNGDDVDSAEIYVIDADSTNERRLTSNSAWDYGASWSPDGQRLAFGSKQDGTWQIYTMHADGSEQRLISGSGGGNAPAWSPDGRWISFTSDRTGNDSIYVMDPSGQNVRRLTVDDSHHDNSAWSPDGSKIAFSSDRDGKNDVFVMNADGTGVTNLTKAASFRVDIPSWSADGKRIVFHESEAFPGGSLDILGARLVVIVLDALLFTALVLYLLRRRSLPVGALTLLVGMSGVILGLVVDEPSLLIVIPIPGLIADLVIWRLGVRRPEPASFHLVGVIIPLVVFGPPLVGMALLHGDDYPPLFAAAILLLAILAGLGIGLLSRQRGTDLARQ